MKARLSSVALAALASVAIPATGQIPQRAQSLVNPNATLLLVATPYTTRSEDSATAVLAGEGLRQRVTRNVGRDYRVITRQDMNRNLAGYGYPADALLDFNAAKTLGLRASAPLMIMPTLTRANGGAVQLNARLISTGASKGVAGFVVSKALAQGQKADDLGEEVADMLKPAFKAYDDATVCFDNAGTDPAKARAAAEKAIKTVPNFGLAEYCLGAIIQKNDSTSQEALQHYMNAVQGDPQSIPSYGAMGSIYFKRGDSTKVIETYQTMLQVDPLDPVLRESAYKIFQAFGRPGAAEEVADAGIARDPGNTDWYDLKSNACLAAEKYSCAVDELERLYEIDRTKADTSFFSKINYAAKLAEDTTRYVKWAVMGVEKYPDNASLLDDANRAYLWSHNPTAAVASAQKILEMDPTATEPMQRTIAALSDAGNTDAIRAMVPMIRASSDNDLKDFFGQVLVGASQKEVQAQNLAKADTLAQAALDAGMVNENYKAFANYFIAVHLLTNEIGPTSQTIGDSKSCDKLKAYQVILERAKGAFAGAGQAETQAIKDFVNQYGPAVDGEIKRMQTFEPIFCK